MFKKCLLLLSAVCIIFTIAGCAQKPKQAHVGHLYGKSRVDNLTPAELSLEKTLKEAAKIKAASDYAKGMFDAAYIVAADHKDLGFTVYFKDGEAVVERGFDASKEPTLVIRLSDDGILNSKRFFQDGKINDEEEFLIVNAVFKPAWEASYRIPELESSWMKKFMKLDDLMHVVLLNPNNYKYQGKVVKNELSVVRADSQWLVFNGLEGISSSRMDMTAQDAVAMYKLIMRDLKTAKSIPEKMEIMNRFEKIRNRCLVKRPYEND